MSTISGDMDPKPPRWLEEEVEAIERLGYIVDSTAGARDEYSKRNDEIGLEYLRLQLTDPDRALEQVPDYFGRFRDINRSVGILNNLTSQQFGLVVNIASLGYSSLDEGRAHFLHRQIDEYLGSKNSAGIPGFTAEIRSPELLRDMVAHWEVINWPSLGGYVRFFEENKDWENVQQQIANSENNPILFALAVPLKATDAFIQAQFRTTYPELSQQGIDIIAARLFNGGAHHELLRTVAREEDREWYENRYKGWEDTIYQALESFSEDYRQPVLESIAEAKWQIFDDTKLSPQSILDKIKHTPFTLDSKGGLVRVER